MARNVDVKLQWVPSYIGLKGNDEDDILYKRGLDLDVLPCYLRISTEM